MIRLDRAGSQVERGKHCQLLQHHLEQVRRMAVLVHFGLRVSLTEIVVVIAHVDSLAARVVAGVLREDDHWIDREVATALVQGRLPVVLDVLVGALGATFADTFLSDRTVDFIKRRRDWTIPVVVVDQQDDILVLLARVVPPSGWLTVLS